MRLIDADELMEILELAKEEVSRKDIRAEDKLLMLYGLNYAIIAIENTLPAAAQWIRVEDDMPPEYESVFKKFKSTPKWLAGMYETISDDVNAVVKFEDGTKKIYTLHTADGKWNHLPILGKPIVTHWMPLPEPPKEGHHEY